MTQYFNRLPVEETTALERVRAAMAGDFDTENMRYKAEARLRGQLVPNDLESFHPFGSDL